MRPNKWRLVFCFALFALVFCCLLAPSALCEQDDESDVEDPSPAPVMSTETVYVKNDARLLSAPEVAAMPLKSLMRGTQVQLAEVDGEWACVQIDALTGYVRKVELSYRHPDDLYSVYAAETAYLHLTDKASSKIMTQVAARQRMVLISVEGSWARVKLNDQVGYMLVKTLTKFPPDAGFVEPVKQGDKGEAVKQMQIRLKELGYLAGGADGDYQRETRQSVLRFQRSALLEETGEADENTIVTMFLSNAPQSHMILSGNAYPANGPVLEVNWWKSDIQSIFARQTVAVVTDVRTGISFRVWRGGGTNHADVQPLTKEDSALMKKAYGGAWSWERRAIWVSVDGQRYAASMNGMPHGQGSIKGNNFNGHFCIHFTKSRTHGTNQVCSVHQARIKEALAAGNQATKRVYLNAKAPEEKP